VIYLIILLVNVLSLYIYKTDKRYWLFPISFWVIFFLFFIIWRVTNDKSISRLNTEYWKSADYNKKNNPDSWRGDERIYQKLKDAEAYVRKYNYTLLSSLFLQTILTFVLQVLGYKRTSLRKTYKWTGIVFGVLLVMSFVLFLLMSIVPTGPFF
jgi:hypothetical protein